LRTQVYYGLKTRENTIKERLTDPGSVAHPYNPSYLWRWRLGGSQFKASPRKKAVVVQVCDHSHTGGTGRRIVV
jgi:hypothetical protein